MLMPGEFSANEKEAVKELKRRTRDEHTPQILRDETIFYRFLKARNFNLNNAEYLIRKHFEDRKLYGFDDILDRYSPPEDMKLYMPSTFLGFDKDGSAIEYIDVGKADILGIVNLCEFKQFALFAGYTIATDMERMTENSLQTGKNAYQYFIIMNMDQLNLFNATFKKGLEYMINGLILYQRNFPERLKEVHIINASYTFTILFQIVKHVLTGDLLNKIHVYGNSGWQEALKKKVDEDVLPAFLGGKRTDPDGDPRCKSFVNHGKKVPAYLYNKKCKSYLKWEEGVQKLTVARSSSSEIKIHVDDPNTNLEWECELKWGDIQFTLCFKENNDSDILEELIPKQKINTEMISQTHTCHKTGTYIFIFDNTNSWIYSKEVHYRIQINKPVDKIL